MQSVSTKPTSLSACHPAERCRPGRLCQSRAGISAWTKPIRAFRLRPHRLLHAFLANLSFSISLYTCISISFVSPFQFKMLNKTYEKYVVSPYICRHRFSRLYSPAIFFPCLIPAIFSRHSRSRHFLPRFLFPPFSSRHFLPPFFLFPGYKIRCSVRWISSLANSLIDVGFSSLP